MLCLGATQVVALAALVLSSIAGTDAFSPPLTNARANAYLNILRSTKTTAQSSLNSIFPTNEVADSIASGLSSSSDLLSDAVTATEYKEFAKTVVIVLLFGGGLIPAAISANKSLIGTLTGKRRGGEDAQEGETIADYVSDSGASGPALSGSALLFASEKIPLADIVAVVGRIKDKDSMADWRNLPSTKVENPVDPENPPMWLPRKMFKENIRKAKFLGWPTDKNGNPVGGEELAESEGARISKQGALIGDAALDAVFDSWAWGASVATPDKVENQLAQWRVNPSNFDLGEFTGAAIRGRAVTGLGALSFIVIQAVAYGTLFIAPFLRVFANIDIGLGEMGACDPEMCTRLF